MAFQEPRWLERRFTVRGAHFRHGLTATIASATPFVVPAANITYVSSTGSTSDFDTLTLTVPARAVPAGGGYALAVRNADGCDVVFNAQCPAGTTPTGADNECQGAFGGASGTGPRSMTFYADPVVTAISPRGQCTARLMPVTITGINFHSTYGVQPVVRIRDVALENVRVTSTTTITADVPASLTAATPLGAPYDVTVTVPEGCAGTLSMGFTLFPPPTVTSVRPGSVCVNLPGTSLTITGTNFHTFVGMGPTVTLGSTPTSTLTNVRVVSETSLTADLPSTTPPGGPYDLTVTSPVGCGVTLPRAFTFHAAPTIASAVAQASCTGGAPLLVVTGTSFHATDRAQPTVTLSGPTSATLTMVRVSSPTTLLAELPLTPTTSSPRCRAAPSPSRGPTPSPTRPRSRSPASPRPSGGQAARPRSCCRARASEYRASNGPARQAHPQRPSRAPRPCTDGTVCVQPRGASCSVTVLAPRTGEAREQAPQAAAPGTDRMILLAGLR